MLGTITKLSAGALLGILVGIALVVWIEPETAGGTALILLVALVLALLVAALARGIVGLVTRKRPTGEGPKPARRE